MNQVSTLPAAPGLTPGWSVRGAARRLSCALLGHRVNSHASEPGVVLRRCGCGVGILAEDGAETRIRHVVSCFLFGHGYVAAGARDGHNEYVCVCCGHPLLFEAGRDPYDGRPVFKKKVRYRCNLFGHRVHPVARRDRLTEYACHCGHSFLRREARAGVIKHPPVCLFAGHFVSLSARRGAYAEYSCRNCGHTFCFRAAGDVA